MAITVLQAPQASGYISAHEDVWHLVDSTNKNTAGFKYVFYIKKNGATLARIVNSPYSELLLGALNIGNIVRTLPKFSNLSVLNLSQTFRNNFPVEFEDEFFFSNYEVEYAEISGNVETYSTSGEYRVYNTYNRHPIHGVKLELNNDYKPFYTNRPDISYYYEGELLILCSKMNTTFGGNVNYFIQNGSETRTISTGLFFGDGYRLINLNGFNQNESSITAKEDVFNTTLEIKTFIKKCSKYKVYTLLFVNAYGCWDSFTFHSGEITTDNEKKKYDLNDWMIVDAPGVAPDYISNKTGSVYNEKTKTYAVEFKTKMKLTSDILNSDEYKWLFELIVSPSVFLYDKDNLVLHPVHITDTNYAIKDSLKNKAEVLEVNIEIDKQNTQFR